MPRDKALNVFLTFKLTTLLTTAWLRGRSRKNRASGSFSLVSVNALSSLQWLHTVSWMTERPTGL